MIWVDKIETHTDDDDDGDDNDNDDDDDDDDGDGDGNVDDAPINHPSARAASKALKFSLISSAWYSSVKTFQITKLGKTPQKNVRFAMMMKCVAIPYWDPYEDQPQCRLHTRQSRG